MAAATSCQQREFSELQSFATKNTGCGKTAAGILLVSR